MIIQTERKDDKTSSVESNIQADSSRVHNECPECGGPVVVRDYELVCSSCGLVLGGYDRFYSPVRRAPTCWAGSKLASLGSRSGYIQIPQYRRESSAPRLVKTTRYVMTNHHRNVLNTANLAARFAEALNLPQIAKTAAVVQAERIMSCNGEVRFSREEAAIAAVIIAIKQHEVPRSLEEVSRVLSGLGVRYDANQLLRLMSRAIKVLRVRYKPLSPARLIPKFLRELDLPESYRSALEDYALRILRNYGGSNTGKRPQTLAAAAILAADLRLASLVDQSLATVSGVKMDTITKLAKHMAASAPHPGSSLRAATLSLVRRRIAYVLDQHILGKN